MPPRGVKKGTKLAREYEHIKESERKSGKSTGLAKEIAARTVNKERARAGATKTSSRTSTSDMSSSRRGGLRSGTSRPKGRTFEQLYNEARKMGIEGRSSMNKAQLERAIERHKGGASKPSRSTASRSSAGRASSSRSTSSRGTTSRSRSSTTGRSTGNRASSGGRSR